MFGDFFEGEKNIGDRTKKAEKGQKGRERGGRSLVTRAGEHPSVHHRLRGSGPIGGEALESFV